MSLWAKGRDAYDLVLQALRRRIALGDIRPGAVVALEALSKEFRTSITPVREALSYLAGQGLIVAYRGRGYAFRACSAENLADLYDLHLGLIETALALRQPTPVLDGLKQALEKRLAGRSPDAPAIVEATSIFWVQLVQTARNEELVRLHGLIDARLGVVRRAEAILFNDGAQELLSLAELMPSAPNDQFRDAVHQYHNRRRHVVLQLSEIIPLVFADLESAPEGYIPK